MAPRAKGSVRFRRGRWEARISLGEGAKGRIELTLSTCAAAEEAKATKRGALLADLAAKLRAAGHVELARPLLERAASRDGKALADVVDAIQRIVAGEVIAPRRFERTTFQSFAEDWTEGRLRAQWPDHVKEKGSAGDDRARLNNHVYPIIGHVPIAEVTLDHADAVMRALPVKLSQGTRRHVAVLMHRVLALAVYPARHLAANPLPKGFMPAIKTAKAFTHLYPAEDARLLACAGVPLPFRVLYGFLAREGMRTSEADGLVWSDLDLAHGAVVLAENKTDSPRSWVLNPGVARALVAWRELVPHDPGDPVFTRAPMRLAEDLRDHLKLAGVDRPALFERSETRQPIRAHDLRATFITVALANGRSETWVMDRTGHTSSTMINRYRRGARSLQELGLGDLMAMDEAIPELLQRKRPGRGGRQKPTSRGRD